MRSDSYARRRPEDTLLYQTIAEHWPVFSERLEQHGGLPRFVEREFDDYLKCGILEFGFLELECRECGHSELVAFSCKRRGFCPSGLARRMSDTAVHLERSVLPEVPIRHWICSFPWGVRAVLGYDARLCASAASAFASELMPAWLRRATECFVLRAICKLGGLCPAPIALEYLRAADRSRDVVRRIQDWALKQEALPRSPLRKAIAYMGDLWPGLLRFLDDPRLAVWRSITMRPSEPCVG